MSGPADLQFSELLALIAMHGGEMAKVQLEPVSAYNRWQLAADIRATIKRLDQFCAELERRYAPPSGN
jgi:hypothetical protein